MNCNYKVSIKDIQSKYTFKIFCTGGNGGSQEEIQELQTQYNQLYNLLPKVTGEGESLSLSNTAEAPLKLDLKGNKGKNLFNKDETTYNSWKATKTTLSTGNRITIVDNSTYACVWFPIGREELLGKKVTIKATISGTSPTHRLSLNFSHTGSQSDVIIGYVSDTTTGTSIDIPAEFPEGSTEVSVLLYGSFGGTVSTGQYTDFTDLQIEIGNQATSYEPYKPYVTGDNTIKLEGKNFLEPKMETATRNGITCTNNGDGSFTLNGTATSNADIRLDQSTPTGSDNLKEYNGTYTLSCNELQNNMNLRVMQNSTWTSPLGMVNNNTPVTGTLNLDRCFIYVAVNNGTTVNNLTIRPMLEKSSTATSYMPYETPTTYQVNIGDTHLNLGDSIEGTIDNWKIVREDTTEEAITDSTLINQLNAIKNSMAYKGATNISQTNDLAPFIINASTLKDLSNL